MDAFAAGQLTRAVDRLHSAIELAPQRLAALSGPPKTATQQRLCGGRREQKLEVLHNVGQKHTLAIDVCGGE